MYKELIVTVIILILIFSLDIITNNYTSYACDELSRSLDNLKLDIQENKIAENKIDDIFVNWKKHYHILAYYIEHDELEKVETELTKLRADIKNEKYEEYTMEIDTTIFILQHIENKEKFNIQNIF